MNGGKTVKEKNFKKIKENSKNLGNLGTLDCEYIIEGQISPQKFLSEEKKEMSNDKIVINQFKKLVRVSLYNHRTNHYKARKKAEEHELLAEEVQDFIKDTIENEYDFLENHITVLNFKMTVKNDLLYEVLSSMQQYQRDVVYLSFCEKMSDQKIGDRLKISRSNVQRTKQSMKKQIYDAMTGGSRNEK